MIPNDDSRPARDPTCFDGRFNPPEQAPSPPGNAEHGTEKLMLTVDVRNDLAVVTWENSGPHLTFRLSTDAGELTFLAGPHVIRQLRQMLSWAAGPANAEDNQVCTPAWLPEQFLARDGAARPAVPPEASTLNVSGVLLPLGQEAGR
jgi:hypothetical protein